jgi:hypothetical protein
MTDVLLAAVIPTRNRADMAITAIRYLREQPGCDLRIFVSDNSSREEEVRKLAEFCSALADPRVTYMRAPENLGQGIHWDWALREALARSNATHVTVHYDRKIMRPGHARAWTAVAERYPDKVFTYVTEFIAAEPPPLRLWRPPWTGKLYRLKTSRTIELSARGEALEMGHTLPVLSNCIVPRAVVESVVARFGDLCQSTTADSCFAYRFCALHDDYLHLDRSLSILYGSHRSAGLGYLSGGGGDFADYLATWRGGAWLDAAPIPGVNLGYNMLFHEYELVRRAVGGDRFPPIERAGYLRDLARGLGWIRDANTRAQMVAMLEEHGWTGDVAPGAVGEHVPLWRRGGLRLRQCVTMFRADHLGVDPQNITGFSFRSDEHALKYALKYPGRPAATAAHLAIVDPVEIDVGAP